MIWDYLVIGAGSSGCAVANPLSQSGRKRVLLLEAGSSDRSLAIKVPGAMSVADLERLNWGYRSAPDPTRDDKSEHWPRGYVVGGTSSINGMNYVRGSVADYDRWAKAGNTGWSAQEVLPLFRELERCDRSISDSAGVRGRAGPLHVRRVKHCHATTRAFIEAGQVAGYPFNPDYNGETQEGIGYAQLSQRGGRRWSAADAFLEPALRRRNLMLMIGAHVRKLVIKERRACGAIYEQHGQLHEAHADHVILCAGADQYTSTTHAVRHW